MPNKYKFIITTYLLILLLPFFLPYLSNELTLSLMLTGLLLIIIFFFQKISLHIPLKIGVPFSAFIFWTIIVYLIQGYNYLLFWEIIKYLILFFIILINYNLTLVYHNISRVFLFLFALFSSIISLNSIIEYTIGIRYPPDKLLLAPFGIPNIAASFYILAFAIVFFELPSVGKNKDRYFRFVNFIFKYLVASAWILSKQYLYFLPLLFVIFYWRNLKLLKIQLKELLLLFLACLATLPNYYYSLDVQTIDPIVSAFQNNIIFLRFSDLLKLTHEVLNYSFSKGIGFGNFSYLYAHYASQPWSWSSYASSELLQTFIENGVISLFFQFLLFFSFAAILLRKRNQVMNIALIAFLLFAQSNISFKIFFLSIIFYFHLSLKLNNSKSFLIIKNNYSIILLFLLFFPLYLVYGSLIYERGKVALYKKQNLQALSSYTLLNKYPIFKENEENNLYLAHLEIENANPEKGINYLNQSIKINSLNPEPKYFLALYYFNNSRFDLTFKYLSEVINYYPYPHPKYYLLYVKTLGELNKIDEKKQILEKINDIYPYSEKLNPYQYILEDNGYLESLKELFTLQEDN